jgi:hypothetical protein
MPAAFAQVSGARGGSSVGQSSGLIIRRSQVQVLPAPPIYQGKCDDVDVSARCLATRSPLAADDSLMTEYRSLGGERRLPTWSERERLEVLRRDDIDDIFLEPEDAPQEFWDAVILATTWCLAGAGAGRRPRLPIRETLNVPERVAIDRIRPTP